MRRELNLPKRLSDHQLTQAHQHPDIIHVQREKDALAQELRDDFGSIKNGSKSPGGISTYTGLRLRALKLHVEREAFTKLLRGFHSAADLDHMVTQLNREKPASKMLTPVPHILEDCRQLAHDLFQTTTESSFAKMVDTMVRLCSLSEGKDQRCSSHKGDTVDRTYKPHACTPLTPVAVDEPIYSADSIDLSLDLDSVKPLEDAEPTKTVRSTKAMKLAASSKAIKLAASSKITEAKKSPTSLTCLFYYGNPKRGRTQNLAVCEDTIDKCTFNTRSVLFPILNQSIGRSSTIQATSPTTQLPRMDRTSEFGLSSRKHWSELLSLGSLPHLHHEIFNFRYHLELC